MKRQNLKQMPCLIGQVTEMSGMSILGTRVMDWAFFQLIDAAADDPFNSYLLFAVSPSIMPWHYGLDPGIPVPEEIPLTEFGNLEKDRYYLKLGRPTGVTVGICNGALASCNWEGKTASDTMMMGTRWICH